MKRNRSIVILMLTLFSTGLAAQTAASTTSITATTPKIHWMNFVQAYDLSKKNPKKIFVDVYTGWCGWCKRMDATTFADPVIVDYMNKNYYNVKMDAEGKDTVVIEGTLFVNPNPESNRSSHQLAIELLRGKMSYPSYVFLNDKSQLITVVAGYQPAKEFEPILHYFGDNAYINQPWEEFRAKFKGEVKE